MIREQPPRIVQFIPGLKSPTDGEAMERLKGLKCRECGRYYPSAPVHVCEFCFGPLEVDYDYEVIRSLVSRKRIESVPQHLALRRPATSDCQGVRRPVGRLHAAHRANPPSWA